MDPADFDSKILTPIADKPQLTGLAQFHLANLHSAMKGLSDLGHRIALDFAPAPAPLEWPKMLYRGAGTAPDEVMEVSTTESEASALAEGWRKTPRAA